MPAPPEPFSRLTPPKTPPPRRDYAAEEEAGRKLTNAHIQMRRGLITEAEAATRALLAERPADAGALELLGDILVTRSDFAGAGAAYQAALKSEPGRASAEAKFGRATLRSAERQREQKLGVAYAASDTSLVRGGAEGKRGAAWSVFGSALCPGLGQIVGGQVTKGIVLIGVFLLGLGLMAILPHGAGNREGGTYFSPAFWIVSAVLAADWIYAVADAALSAPSKDNSPSEKDGWQV